jgi:beta-phosphoglucomutase-like phosphatase (HAD superfamily)
MGVPARPMLVIEDSTSGMIAWVAVGMQVIAYVAGHASVPALPDPSIQSVRHLTEIAPLLGINT